jgi:hypothetical protein
MHPMRKLLAVAVGLTLSVAGSAHARSLTNGLDVSGGQNAFAKVSLQRVDGIASEDGLIRLHMTVAQAQELKGYGFVLKYDPARFEFVETTQLPSGLLGPADGSGALFVSSSKTPGEITVGSMRVDSSAGEGSGDLVEFVFKSIHTPVPGDFQVAEGVLIDLSGKMDPLLNVEVGNLSLLPESYGLDQNHPNPFNPSTTINYQMPEEAQVKLVIYNLLGQQIKTLVNERVEAGFHKIVWDGTDEIGRQVASGVYVYRMDAGSFHHTRRMMLVK